MLENYFNQRIRVCDAEIKEDIEELFIEDYTYDLADDLMSKYNVLVDNRLGVRINIDHEKVYRHNTLTDCAIISKFYIDHDPSMKKYYQKLSKCTLPDIPKKIRKIMERRLQAGTYHGRLDQETFIVLFISTYADDEDEGYLGTKTTLYFLGKKCRKYAEEFWDYMKKIKDKYYAIRKNDLILNFSGRGYYNKTVTKFKSFDQMVFRNKKEILDYINNWRSKVPFYYSKYHFIPKLSILLYGPPGTGKSTFCQAIANHFGFKECNNLLPSYFGDKARDTEFYGPISMDDIDTFAISRENENYETLSDDSREQLNRILSFLDHPTSIELKDDATGMSYPVSIVIATTNYYEKLDPAMIRPGRFDLKIHMDFFNYEEARIFCQLYNIDLNKLFPTIDKDTFTICPAELETICINNIDTKMKEV